MPGIIANTGKGKDNRNDIKAILRAEMAKPNSKLCVILEPVEYASNPVIEFCDESFGENDKWRENSIFLMTKFDKQIGSTRSANSANAFFGEYIDNGITPYLAITETLRNEKKKPEELYKLRQNLLLNADQCEAEKFSGWHREHEETRAESDDDQVFLSEEIAPRVGFPKALQAMRGALLKDTLERIPEVINALLKDRKDRA